MEMGCLIFEQKSTLYTGLNIHERYMYLHRLPLTWKIGAYTVSTTLRTKHLDGDVLLLVFLG